jgi:hypothetical protein
MFCSLPVWNNFRRTGIKIIWSQKLFSRDNDRITTGIRWWIRKVTDSQLKSIEYKVIVSDPDTNSNGSKRITISYFLI